MAAKLVCKQTSQNECFHSAKEWSPFGSIDVSITWMIGVVYRSFCHSYCLGFCVPCVTLYGLASSRSES